MHTGQTVMHVHIHLIPRYVGDVSNPRGGVRGMIPAQQDYGAAWATSEDRMPDPSSFWPPGPAPVPCPRRAAPRIRPPAGGG
ncbi:hypothetical protein [Cupriavidus necator]|uniref:hypothetical protein n=1 Tax=Cupriavidus necator TaxID=106590 RepID=UPI003B8A5AD5